MRDVRLIQPIKDIFATLDDLTQRAVLDALVIQHQATLDMMTDQADQHNAAESVLGTYKLGIRMALATSQQASERE